MKISKVKFEGVFIIENFHHQDNRGDFIKNFNSDIFLSYGIDFVMKESYFSINKKNVIRGMHFQLPPSEHSKLVTVTNGKILDVLVDLRKESKTYLKTFKVEISNENKISLFIPTGIAHGFKSLKNNTYVNYYVDSVYNQKDDFGVRYNSFDFDWEISKPILSEKDKSLLPLNKFISPF